MHQKQEFSFSTRSFQAFSKFMERLAKLEELVAVGRRFLYEFHINLEQFRGLSLCLSSKIVDRILKTTFNDRVEAYVGQGCKHVSHVVDAQSKLHSSKEGLTEYILGVKALLKELECLKEDAIFIAQEKNGIINDLYDGSFVDEIKTSKISFGEEGSSLEDMCMQDKTLLYATLTAMMFNMLVVDYDMQKKIVDSANLSSSSSELQSYCQMMELRPYIRRDIMKQSWKLVNVILAEG